MEVNFQKVKEQGMVLQNQLPWLELVAVGGTAAAMHAGHRFSTDVDNVTPLLKSEFDLVAETLGQWEGWKTHRFNKPIIILGERHDVELGIRQQMRTIPLEKEICEGLVIPTVAETLRIKAFLLGKRKATRDYVDVAALSDFLGSEAALEALVPLNAVYPAESGLSALSQFAAMSKEAPFDLEDIILEQYKGIRPPYDRWQHVQAVCSRLGHLVFELEMNDPRIGNLADLSFQTVKSVKDYLNGISDEL